MSRATLKAIQAAAGNAGESAVYADDVFSTYLYTGNSSTQTITNGIDLAGEGGLVWQKGRSANVSHYLWDTERGSTKRLSTNTNGNEITTDSSWISSFNSDGFNIGNSGAFNASGDEYASWTFRKQPGFFDVVTYSGNSSTQTISHNLGAVPGMIIIKRYDGGLRDWAVYHRSVGNGSKLTLNGVGTPSAFAGWNYTTPTDTEFYLGNDGDVNNSAGTYVAYLFAHDDQRFGENEDESIISCGSYTASTNAFTNLGWEPQWIIYKDITNTGGWVLWDTMRGLPGIGTTPGQYFQADLSDAEASSTNNFKVGATGFYSNNGGGRTYIYIAIRRPHKPASKFAATQLFDLGTRSGISSNPVDITGVNFPVDAALIRSTNQQEDNAIGARLTGKNAQFTNLNSSQFTRFQTPGWDHQDGVSVTGDLSKSGYTYIDYFFRRAPGFFDVVAYTGGTNPINHGLGVTPEMIWVKRRDGAAVWAIYHEATGLSNNWDWPSNGAVYANQTYTAVSATSFSGKTNYTNINYSGYSYVAYLFATAPGISKVGSYTGTGSDLNVDCGFASGARFVFIKRNGSGDWYVYDSERGIVSGNDPYWLLNSNSAQVTTTDYIDPLSSGFTITSSAPAALNSSGDTYIFFAIA